MAKADGKSRDAEMRRNDTNRNPAGTGADRFQPNDSAGASSSHSRSTKSGAEHGGSKSSARISGGGGSGASSRNADQPAPSGREQVKETPGQAPESRH